MARPSQISPRGSVHHDSFMEVDGTGFHMHHEEGHQMKLSGIGGSEHTIELEEAVAFSNHINNCLQNDPLLARLLPLNPDSNDLFDKLKDGLILIQLINLTVPNTINMKKVNKDGKMSIYKIQENLNFALKGAEKIGCHIVNIGANDIIEKRQVLVLGLIWQIVRLQLLSKINITDPALQLLANLDTDTSPRLSDAEEAATSGKGASSESSVAASTASSTSTRKSMSPEAVLLKWVNYLLKKSGSAIRVRNFGSDFKDPHIFGIIMMQLKRLSNCSSSAVADFDAQFADLPSLDEYARVVIAVAGSEFGVKAMITPDDLLRCKSSKLILSFTAQLFNANHGLHDLDSISCDSQDQTSVPNLPEVSSLPLSNLRSLVLGSDAASVEGFASPEKAKSQSAISSLDSEIASEAKRRSSRNGNKTWASSVLSSPSSLSSNNSPFATPVKSEGSIGGELVGTNSPSVTLSDTYGDQEDLEQSAVQGEVMLQGLRSQEKARSAPPVKRANSASSSLFVSSNSVEEFNRPACDCAPANQQLEQDNQQSQSAGQTSKAIEVGSLRLEPIVVESAASAESAEQSSGSISEQDQVVVPEQVVQVLATRSSDNTTNDVNVNDSSASKQCAAVVRSANNSAIRVLQHRPAWALHAMLRAFELPYKCENVSNMHCFGYSLPLLCVGEDIVHPSDAYSYLLDSFNNSDRLSTLTADELLWYSFVETNVLKPFALYNQLSGQQLAQEQRLRRYDLGSIVSSYWNLSFLKRYLADSNSEQTLTSIAMGIDHAYQLLSNRLEASSGVLVCTAAVLSLPDCMLLGHLLEASMHPVFTPHLHKYPAICKYLTCLKTKLFCAPSVTRNMFVSWKESMRVTSTNSFLTDPIASYQEPASRLVAELRDIKFDNVVLSEDSKYAGLAAFGGCVSDCTNQSSVSWVQSVKLDVDIQSGIAQVVRRVAGKAEAASAAISDDPSETTIGLGGCLFTSFVIGSFAIYAYRAIQ